MIDDLERRRAELEIDFEREIKIEGDNWDGGCRMCGREYDSYLDHIRECPAATD